MARIKYSKNHKKHSSPFFALVPSGDTLVAIFTNPGAVLDRFRKDGRDHKKVYRTNSN